MMMKDSLPQFVRVLLLVSSLLLIGVCDCSHGETFYGARVSSVRSLATTIRGHFSSPTAAKEAVRKKKKSKSSKSKKGEALKKSDKRSSGKRSKKGTTDAPTSSSIDRPTPSPTVPPTAPPTCLECDDVEAIRFAQNEATPTAGATESSNLTGASMRLVGIPTILVMLYVCCMYFAGRSSGLRWWKGGSKTATTYVGGDLHKGENGGEHQETGSEIDKDEWLDDEWVE